jgi:O-antigen ligase
VSAVGDLLGARSSTVTVARHSARPWLLAVAAAGLTAGLAGANGGYFPTSFGWTALALSFAALVALVRGAGWPGPAASAFAGGLTALLAWVSLSAAWSPSLSQTVIELERTSVYVAGVGCLLLLVRREDVARLVGGIVAGIWVVAAYGLATRLLPERLGDFDPIAGYRLAEPLGYWNALGILCTLGLLLTLGLAARAGSIRARAAAGACAPLLLTTVYFTFGRATWISLGFGLVLMFAVDRRRFQLAASSLAALCPAVIVVALAAGSPALTRADAPLAAAAEEGRSLGLAIVALTIAAGLLIVLTARLEPKIVLGRTARHATAAIIAATVAGAASFGVVHAGGPAAIAERAKSSFSQTAPGGEVELNERLFTLAANGRQEFWTAAWHGAESNPLIGLGAGGYEQHWLATRDQPFKVRDAHSLYLETLAELGPLGLALLLVALGAPVAAGLRRRDAALAAPLLGAYLAYILHAGVDWDWEMTSVTLAALACGAGLVVLGTDRDRSVRLTRPFRLAAGALAIAVAGFGLVFALGATALSESQRAVSDGRFADAAAHARRATALAPWSVEPLRALADAQLATGDDGAAANLREAIGREPADWSLWLDLARASEGSARADALAHATRLNPLSPELALFQSEIASEDAIAIGAEELP